MPAQHASQGDIMVADLAGDLNLQTVGAARDALLEVIGADPRAQLRLQASAVVDLSGVQLLEAARRTASAAGGALTLATPAEGALLETLRRGGFLHSADQRRFWLKEGV